jgi:molybdopterin synthase catalytic subunit
MIEIRREDFSIDEIVEGMKRPGIGAILAYVGTVREFPKGAGIKFEDDENATAVRKLGEIKERAIARFDIEDVAIIHRVGFLPVSENILLVAISAAHREPAFDALRSIIDDIKDFHKAWKREVRK